MFAYCGNDPVMHIDTSGNWAVFWGETINVNIGIGITISAGFALDSEGNYVKQFSYAIPAVNDTYSIGVFDFGCGYYLGGADIDSVDELAGYGTYQGASGGAIGSVGIDLIVLGSQGSFAQTKNQEYNGGQIVCGIGGGFDMHHVYSYTKNTIKRNIFNDIMATATLICSPIVKSSYLSLKQEYQKNTWRQDRLK